MGRVRGGKNGRSVQVTNRVRVVSTRLTSPVGSLLAAASDEGLYLLEFVDDDLEPAGLRAIRRWFDADPVPGSNRHLERLTVELDEYFAGRRREFTVPVVLRGTPFQERVWQGLLTIPYGATRSYQDQAVHLGNPRALRAVAQANGDNRIAVIVPCHRVIGKDGRLTGYGGGLWRKRFLLDLEANNRA